MTKNTNSGCLTILMAVIFFGMILGVLFPNRNKDTSTPQNPSYLTSEEKLGHDYARARMRQEGFSDKEAKEAADVIMRFHRAQSK